MTREEIVKTLSAFEIFQVAAALREMRRVEEEMRKRERVEEEKRKAEEIKEKEKEEQNELEIEKDEKYVVQLKYYLFYNNHINNIFNRYCQRTMCLEYLKLNLLNWPNS